MSKQLDKIEVKLDKLDKDIASVHKVMRSLEREVQSSLADWKAEVKLASDIAWGIKNA